MPTLYLVRHGRAAESWEKSVNPGLDEEGRAQASRAASTLSAFAPKALITSPMRRCRETAAPLEATWNKKAVVNECVSEIASPTEDIAERGRWLQALMSGGWPGADAASRDWRQGVVDALMSLEQDCVVFSHFVAINVAVGHATNSEDVLVFRPGNCSVTIISNDGGSLQLLERGVEAETVVG